jgi:hypothetical protein
MTNFRRKILSQLFVVFCLGSVLLALVPRPNCCSISSTRAFNPSILFFYGDAEARGRAGGAWPT